MTKNTEQLTAEIKEIKQKLAELEEKLQSANNGEPPDGLEAYHTRSEKMRYENANEIYELGHS